MKARLTSMKMRVIKCNSGDEGEEDEEPLKPPPGK